MFNSSGGGGFGQNANTGGTGFGGGGFGAGNTGGGFGTSGTTGTGFGGGNTSGGGLFGATSSGFGAGGAGFGANPSNTSNNLFGAKPSGFGAAGGTSGSIFGGGGTTTAAAPAFGGGFGGASSTTPGFGAANTGPSLFGANKPAFGATVTTGAGTSLFGGGAPGGFGATANTTSAFPASTALGGVTEPPPGTANPLFQSFAEKEPNSTVTNHYQSISFMQPYQKWSFEELRLADYAQGRRYGNSNNQAGAFGSNTGFGTFGGAGNTGTSFGGASGNTAGGNLFGASATSTTPFGGTANTGGFGGNTQTGGIFGAKPATGGLFGATTTTSQPSGGLFGTTNTGTGFGNTGATGGFGTGSTTGGGLFGTANQNQNQQKPFSFNTGNTSSTGTGFGANTGGGFGTTPASTGGLFGGGTQTSTPFGGNQQQPQQGTNNLFGGFGAQVQQNTQPQNSGGFGAFGANNPNTAPKTLFGAAPAVNTGGLFGNTGNQQPTGSNLFGNTASSSAPTLNLFNTSQNNQQKPGGLFGNTQPALGGSLFGNNQNQANTSGGGIFGGNQQNEQKPSLFSGFGGNNQQSSNIGGSSLFGNNNNQPALGSSFNQQPQGSSLFGSLQNQQGQQPQFLTSSVNDPSPYGANDLFKGFGTPNGQSVGPLATPLSSSQKLKKNAILPQYKINPSASSRLVTPQKQGYGFSYSRYGTPNSITSSTNTPLGLSSSLLGGSLGRSLGKSLSTTNLRRSFDSDDSVLAPGAFTANSSRASGTGSLKKLVINRSIRGDLFSSPEPVNSLLSSRASDQPNTQRNVVKKRVSFDSIASGGDTNNSNNLFGQAGSSSATNGGHPLRQTENSSSYPSAQDMGFLRSNTDRPRVEKTNGAMTNGTSQPEMEQVKGNELAVVPEEGSPSANPALRPNGVIMREDPQIGNYFTKPSFDELKAMPHEKLKKVSNFQVGRENAGFVTFNVPVDMTTIDWNKICGDIVVINLRTLTVYMDPATKPERGKGLNLPATITLYNSWPRERDHKSIIYDLDGPKVRKHIMRLQRVGDTKFLDYNPKTGTWRFSVEHFTTYGIDYEDNEDMTEDFTMSTLSAPPDTPTPKSRTPNGQFTNTPLPPTSDEHDSSIGVDGDSEIGSSDPDDTFDFKKKRILPGAFDAEESYVDNETADEQDYGEEDQSFLDERSVGSHSDDVMEDGDAHQAGDESAMLDDGDTARSHQEHGITTVLRGEVDSPFRADSNIPGALTGQKSILKSSVRYREQNPALVGRSQLARQEGLTPLFIFSNEDDWTEQLQRTVSPKKQDRQALRESQGTVLKEIDRDRDATLKLRKTVTIGGQGQAFSTSIDLMNSLFGKDQGKKSQRVNGVVAKEKEKGFEWPFPKKSKTLDLHESSMNPMDKESHQHLKPSWGPDGSLICALSARPFSRSKRTSEQGLVIEQKGSFSCDGKDLVFAKLLFPGASLSDTLLKQFSSFTHVSRTTDGIPMAQTSANFKFETLSDDTKSDISRGSLEKTVLRLAAILWDDIDPDQITAIIGDKNEEARAYMENLLRKEQLSALFERLVTDAAKRQVRVAESRELAAIAYLSMHDVPNACCELADAGDFRLATVVSMIGGDAIMRKDMAEQLAVWRQFKAISEMMDSVRAIYELLAGNPCFSEGMKGPVEDRAKSFLISTRFGMDWRQTFGLYLWYGILEEQPLEDAVRMYAHDLEKHSGDIAAPVPWYVEQGIPAWWNDKHSDQRVDMIWGLLKYYAETKTGKLSEEDRQMLLADILLPANQDLSPLDLRLSWQLHSLFTARGIGSLSEEKANQLTLDYASQLESSGQWTNAMLILLHLSDPELISGAGRAMIARHAGEIDADTEACKVLIKDAKIPEVWFWEARAMYARSVEHNHVKELEFLIKAKNWEEAHATFCRYVAPTLVVEDDQVLLRRLLNGFLEIDRISDWTLGGQVYLDYINLLEIKEDEEIHHSSAPRGSRTPAVAKGDSRKGLPRDNSVATIVRRLTGALPQMLREDRSEGLNIVKVAVQEMSAVVGQYVLKRKDENHDAARVLQLPVTEDLCLKNTMEMSLRYYQGLLLSSSSVSVRTRARG